MVCQPCARQSASTAQAHDVLRGLETRGMVAGLGWIHGTGVIRMNVAYSRWFVTIKLEPEATVITS